MGHVGIGLHGFISIDPEPDLRDKLIDMYRMYMAAAFFDAPKWELGDLVEFPTGSDST